jgi:hypothetical protein
LSSAGSGGSALLSFFVICSNCSHRGRFQISQTLPTAFTWLYGRRRVGKQEPGLTMLAAYLSRVFHRPWGHGESQSGGLKARTAQIQCTRVSSPFRFGVVVTVLS